MMRQMRENTKWIMLLTALAFVALMVFEWGMDITGQSGGFGELGRVNGTSVMYDQYMATYRNLYDQVSRSQAEPVTTQQNREIEDAAWHEVVNQILIRQELGRRGIRVTDEEVRQAARFSPPPELRESPAFQTDGAFDLQKYQQFLASPAADDMLLLQLEAYYRDVIPRGKLLRQVTSGIWLSDPELWQAWRDEHERVEVRYVSLDPATRIADAEVEVSRAEVEAYYRDRREDFAVPGRATVKIAVLPKAPLAPDTAASLERAREIRAEIVAGADFAEVAERESADSASARQGGDLGEFTRGQMVAAFDSAAFAAPVGQVTEPLASPFGFHVLEVTARSGDTARARHVLVRVERTDESEIRLLTLADSLDALGASRNLEEAAEPLDLPVETVEITDNFPFAPGAGQVSEGADWAFEEAEPGEVSPVFENRQAFYAFELVSRSPAGYLSLEEARPTIEETLRLRKKVERAVEEGRELVEEVRSGRRTLAEAAETRGLEVRTAGPFSRLDFVPGLGRQNAAVGAAFGLEEGHVSDVVRTETNAFVLELLGRTPADRAAWEAQKESQRAQLAAQLQQARLEQWLEALRESARIVDRRSEVLRPADEEDQRPRMPLVF